MTYSQYDDDDAERGPVGLLGRLRQSKVLTWVLIIGLVGLSVGATSLIWLFQAF